MKTFDEAFQKVGSSDVLEENLLSGEEYLWNTMKSALEHMSNEKFVATIKEISFELFRKVSTTDELSEALSHVSATLHAVFQVGLLVGMEMEKTE